MHTINDCWQPLTLHSSGSLLSRFLRGSAKQCIKYTSPFSSSIGSPLHTCNGVLFLLELRPGLLPAWFEPLLSTLSFSAHSSALPCMEKPSG